MDKANCGASMKPQQKSTPKMAKGGYAGKSRMAMGGMMGGANTKAPNTRAGGMPQRKAPQSVQSMTAVAQQRNKRK